MGERHGSRHFAPFMSHNVRRILLHTYTVTVGFSHLTEKQEERKFSDNIVAADNYILIQKFFDRYPHLRSHEFYLSSESYGGKNKHKDRVARFLIQHHPHTLIILCPLSPFLL
jgi:Serine carboxypeptidase